MPSLITKRGKKRWRATVMFQGQRKDKLYPDATRESKREASLWEKEVLEKMKKQRTDTDCWTIKNWAEEYLDDSLERHSKKTNKEKLSVFKRLIKFFSPETLIEDITTAFAMEYLREQAKTRSGNASNKDRKNLSSAWEWGCKYLDNFPKNNPNPFKAVDKFSEIRSPRYVPPEEDFWKVYEITEKQDKVMLLTFLHLAARRMEIFNLQWSDIDFVNKKVRLWTNKRRGGNRESDLLAMTEELRKTLLNWWEKRPYKETPYVFVCLDKTPFCEQYYGKPFTNRQHFMKRLCKKAKVKPFGFHSIRHLTSSILYHKGCNVAVIQSLLRHKSPTTTNRYLRSVGLENTRTALEQGLSGPTKVIPFSTKKKVSRG